MSDFTEPEMIECTVMCHTENCGNAEHAITLFVDKIFPYVICGVCNNRIMDLSVEQV
jgi:hypothetical protein